MSAACGVRAGWVVTTPALLIGTGPGACICSRDGLCGAATQLGVDTGHQPVRLIPAQRVERSRSTALPGWVAGLASS
ncbi:hypothetical protein [Streptomyces chiangmaiensis]|uniref:Secreted protein n=1 Tax=Streptomyces chiangmaiensis TaxID=766497 RepID=A0ABU7FSK1_9ACTN|nr:hypothetical protein [Streptomyces chiangmaiensis]MED7827091.1 hypothetical protein [Streptomyces chiangmaiensis]